MESVVSLLMRLLEQELCYLWLCDVRKAKGQDRLEASHRTTPSTAGNAFSSFVDRTGSSWRLSWLEHEISFHCWASLRTLGEVQIVDFIVQYQL